MATNAYGTDFWVGRIFRSKDKREDWRHVVIAEMKNGRAKCHTVLPGKTMTNRGTWIAFKNLATRWKTCTNAECYCKAKS